MMYNISSTISSDGDNLSLLTQAVNNLKSYNLKLNEFNLAGEDVTELSDKVVTDLKN